MGFIDVISKVFGNKSQRDMHEVMPYVQKINSEYEYIDKLSDDELRAKSQAIMQQINDYVKEQKNKIQELKNNIPNLEIDKREAVYNEVDALEKEKNGGR